MIDGSPASPLLAHWRSALPLVIGEQGSAGGEAPRASPLGEGALAQRRRLDRRRRAHRADGRSRRSPGSSWGSRGRSVVALTATSRASAICSTCSRTPAVSQLQGDAGAAGAGRQPARRRALRGRVRAVVCAGVDAGGAASGRAGRVGVVAGLLLALGVFSVLQRIAARRRGCNGWRGQWRSDGQRGRRGVSARPSRWRWR